MSRPEFPRLGEKPSFVGCTRWADCCRSYGECAHILPHKKVYDCAEWVCAYLEGGNESPLVTCKPCSESDERRILVGPAQVCEWLSEMEDWAAGKAGVGRGPVSMSLEEVHYLWQEFSGLIATVTEFLREQRRVVTAPVSDPSVSGREEQDSTPY